MFKKSSKSRLVILIKNNALVFCEGNFDGADLKIDKLFFHKVDFDIYEKGKISNEVLLAEEIKKAIKKHNVKTKKTSTYINWSDIIKKTLVVPYIADENDFDDLIHAEISQLLPIDLDNYSIKYKIISEDKREDSHNVKLNCAIMVKENIESYRRVILQAGLEPTVLDIGISAVENLIKYIVMSNSDEPSFYKKNVEGTSIALVELNISNCSVAIFKNGVLDFDRIIKTPIALPDTLKEVEHIKNIDDVKSEESFELLNDILAEINLVFKYYSTRDRNNAIDQIFLFGESAKIKGLDAYTQDILQITTNSVTTLKNIYENDIPDETISTYIDAIGGLIRW